MPKIDTCEPKRRRVAGCSSTLRSAAARSGPAKKKKAACRCGTEVAASSPSGLPQQGSRSSPAPCTARTARFTCTRSSRTFGKIRASFHSCCFYVQPTSGGKDPATSNLFSKEFYDGVLVFHPRKHLDGWWRSWKNGRWLQRRVGGG